MELFLNLILILIHVEISEPIKTREITIDNTDYKISSLAKKAAEG